MPSEKSDVSPKKPSGSHLDYKKKKKEKKDVKKEEVFIIRQKLEKITKSSDPEQALDLLERLGEIDMNFEILKETMIGFTVHAVKKSSSDEEIILKSKTLIKVRIFEEKFMLIASKSRQNSFRISLVFLYLRSPSMYILA